MKKYLHDQDKKYVENICHQFPNLYMSSNPDKYMVQKQPPVVFIRPATLLKRDPKCLQMFFCEHCKIFKNTYFEKHLRMAASDSNYILHKKWTKIIQDPDWPFVSFWNIKLLYFTYSHSFSFIWSLAVIHCHSLSFFVARCHSLSLVVIHCHSLSLVVIRSTTRCLSLSLVVPLVCLFINDPLHTCLYLFDVSHGDMRSVDLKFNERF